MMEIEPENLTRPNVTAQLYSFHSQIKTHFA